MNRQDRFMQRNRKVAQARRGGKDTAFGPKFAAFREDAGWKMNEGQYAEYTASEGKFNKAYGEGESALNSARQANQANQGKVDAASESLSGLSGTSLDNEWSTFKKGFTPVRIVNDGKVESTHYLPKSAVDAMDSKINQSYFGNYVDNGSVYNIDVQTRGGGGKRGEELRTSMIQGEQEIKSRFYEKNAPAVKQSNAEFSSGMSEATSNLNTSNVNLATQRADIESNFNTLRAAKTKREGEKKKIATDYSTALQGRRDLMKSGK